MNVTRLSPAHAAEIVDVLSDAFHDYPVMRYVLGASPHYARRLPVLIGLFVSGRALRNEPMFGIRDEQGKLIAAALVTPPDSQDPPPAFLERRESVWRELGSDARAGYDDCIKAWSSTAIAEPHHSLNMIGVRRSLRGTGLARPLLEAVQALADGDSVSTGVGLTTEHSGNLSLYERFGYRVQGHTRVSDTLETWTLFRPRQAPA